MNTLTWERKSTFSDTYIIKEEENEIGSLFYNSFKLSAQGIINGKEYIYEKKNLWASGFTIITGDKGCVGEVRYAAWRSDIFIILYNNKKFLFRNLSSWKEPKLITDPVNQTDHLKFTSRSFSKKNLIDIIDTSNLDQEERDLLILLGLYLKVQTDVSYYFILLFIIFVIVIS